MRSWLGQRQQAASEHAALSTAAQPRRLLARRLLVLVAGAASAVTVLAVRVGTTPRQALCTGLPDAQAALPDRDCQRVVHD